MKFKRDPYFSKESDVIVVSAELTFLSNVATGAKSGHHIWNKTSENQARVEGGAGCVETLL